MGVDLIPIGNHTISFNNKTLEEVAIEVQQLLNNYTLPNYEFLKQSAINWWSDDLNKQKEILTKKEWSYTIENGPDVHIIYFWGPLDLELELTEHFITFLNPHIRLSKWLGEDDFNRNDWRKYLFSITTLFGGNKVLYAADSGCFLEHYTYYEGSFKEMELELHKKYGQSATDFTNIEEYKYLIDNFIDID